jgi:hypothetical protein
MKVGMPPRSRNQRLPAACDAPTAIAASSLVSPWRSLARTTVPHRGEATVSQATSSAPCPSAPSSTPLACPSTPPRSRCCDDQLNPPTLPCPGRCGEARPPSRSGSRVVPEPLGEEVGNLLLHRVAERVAVEEDHVPPVLLGEPGGGGGAIPTGRASAPRGRLLEAHADAADTDTARPAIVAASPYPADEPMTRATGPSPSGVTGAGTACHISSTSCRQPPGWESRNRKPRLLGAMTRSLTVRCPRCRHGQRRGGRLGHPVPQVCGRMDEHGDLDRHNDVQRGLEGSR